MVRNGFFSKIPQPDDEESAHNLDTSISRQKCSFVHCFSTTPSQSLAGGEAKQVEGNFFQWVLGGHSKGKR